MNDLCLGHSRPPLPALCRLWLPWEGAGARPQRPSHCGALPHQVQGAQAAGGLYVFRWEASGWSDTSNPSLWLAVSHPWTELDHVSYNPLYVEPLVHKLKSMSSSCLYFREFLLRIQSTQLPVIIIHYDTNSNRIKMLGLLKVAYFQAKLQ